MFDNQDFGLHPQREGEDIFQHFYPFLKGEVKRHFRPELDIFSERHDVLWICCCCLFINILRLIFHLITQVQSQT